jgi:hypothetical protein
MNKLFTVKAVMSVFLIVSSEWCFPQQFPDGPYFGQTPPGLTPEVFAPGLVSQPNRRETKIVFSPDGLECFIGTVVNNTFTFLYTKLENGHWSDPVQADFLGTQDKREPFISPDGQKLFFIRSWADIWMSTKINGQWSAPAKLASPISTTAEEWHPTVTLDGTLYFCSTRDGGYYLYRSRLEDGQYKQAEKLELIINSSQYGAADPFIASDESYLIFTSGQGNGDQYISYQKEDGNWSNPENLGSAINTSGIEYGSYITYDDKYYFFSRPAGWGPDIQADIYWVDSRALFTNTSTINNPLNELPRKFNLNQNYPNPFNSMTNIQYSVEKPSHIKLVIYSLQGQKIKTLVDQFQPLGEYSVVWDGTNNTNNPVTSGIYFFRFETDDLNLQKKMLFIR